MYITVVFALSLAIFFLARSNYYMNRELHLGEEETIEKFAQLDKLNKKLAVGELLTLDEVTNNINLIKHSHAIESKKLKRRVEDLIINIDDMAGARANTYVEKWKLEEEKNIRKDAIKRSQNTIKGKVTEHLVPHLPGFSYDPRDAKFLGMPLDFVVFEGLSAGNVTRVVFVEVKTGKAAKLTTRERQCRDAIIEGRVAYELIHVKA